MNRLAFLPRAEGALLPLQIQIARGESVARSRKPCRRIGRHQKNVAGDAAWRRKSSALAMASSSSAMASSSPQPPLQPPPLLVKVCGVTHPDDAALAAAAGADLIGVILWPKAKRAVTSAQARAIGEAARRAAAGVQDGGGEDGGDENKGARKLRRRPSLVGVFVDETAEAISRAAQEADLDYVQLHGDGAREALPDLLLLLEKAKKKEGSEGEGRSFGVVFVLTVGSDGVPTSKTPAQIFEGRKDAAATVGDPRPDLLLVDGPTPGSGEAWDWGGPSAERAALVARASSRAGTWLLAGGLDPGNVDGAVEALGPGGVDVSSGVCGEDGLRKDAGRVAAFVDAARGRGRKR